MRAQAVEIAGHVLALERLDPYPRTPDDRPAVGDYRATLVVPDAD